MDTLQKLKISRNCRKKSQSTNLGLNILVLKIITFRGSLGGSINRACNSWSKGYECRDYLKIKSQINILKYWISHFKITTSLLLRRKKNHKVVTR